MKKWTINIKDASALVNKNHAAIAGLRLKVDIYLAYVYNCHVMKTGVYLKTGTVIFVIFDLLLAGCFPSACDSKPISPEHLKFSWNNEKNNAILSAKRILGFDNKGNYTAERFIIKNCQIPFLYSMVNGKPAWKVTVDSITLTFNSPDKEIINPCVKSIEVVVLEEGFKPLIIDTIPPENASFIKSRVKLAAGEALMHSTGESFYGLPDKHPDFDFRKMAQKTFSESPASMIEASKQIVAMYVLFADNNQKYRDSAWIIYTRGMPRKMVSPPPMIMGERKIKETPVGYYDNWRVIFNLRGNTIRSGNGYAPEKFYR